jgi:hypothetical protein
MSERSAPGEPVQAADALAGGAAEEASFFAQALATPEAEPQPRYVAPPWMRVPLEFVPTSFPISELVGVTDDGLAVVLGPVEVFPTGIWFGLRATPQPGNDSAADAAAHPDLYPAFAGFGAARLARRLRVGLLFDDGRTATNLFIHGPEEATEPPPAVLRIDGGQGGPEGVASQHWAWPIPAEGDLTLVISWPARGIAEWRKVLPGNELRAAAAASAANEIWPGAGPPQPR